jgi:hypothetical protein
VNVDPKTGEAAATSGKQLEGVLNRYDKAINALVACRSEFVSTNAARGSEYFHWIGLELAE